MKFDWDKVQYISIGCAPALAQPNGSNVKRVDSMMYLGGVLTVDGNSATELAKDIVVAMNDFNILQRLWSHANLLLPRKLTYFQSIVLAKLQFVFLWNLAQSL